MHPSRQRSRGLRPDLVAVALLVALAGCVAPPGLERGLSGRDAEWARTRGPGEFSVVSATPGRAVVSALGHQVAIEPADGFCLAREAIETSDRSAFLLLGDCALEEPAARGQGADALLDLPRGVPGIITVSISGDPGFTQAGGAGDLSELQRFVESAEGRALLGRGGDGAQVSVVETRAIGNCLYVLVEDGDGSVPVLAPRFWRAFVELNQRLAVVTISGFRDRPLPEEEMLRHLGDQVRQLQVANSEPIDEQPVQLAEAWEPRAPAWPTLVPRTEAEAIEEEAEDQDLAIADIQPTSVIVATASGGEGFWPTPARRRVPAGARGTASELLPGAPPRRPTASGAGASGAGESGAAAPVSAPVARARP